MTMPAHSALRQQANVGADAKSAVSPGVAGDNAGWSARLNLRFEAREVIGATRTVMTERSHFGPLRLLKPLYP